jgi:two-component system, NarL family, invasion response regulator UvrY
VLPVSLPAELHNDGGLATGMPSRKIRIFILDDHPAVREGLANLLSRFGMTVCGEAGSCKETMQALLEVFPDLVLVDLSLGDESGLDIVPYLHAAGIKSLIYSMHDDAWNIRRSMNAGVNGYVTKREMADTLNEAIQQVLADQTYISPAAAEALQEQAFSGEDPALLEKLSHREHDVFRLAGEGCSTTEMADELHIAVSTVETNLARIIVKLGLPGTKELRRYAIQHLRKTVPK